MDETDKPFRNDPVMPFSLEEEFKVIDIIVRIEDQCLREAISGKKSPSVWKKFKRGGGHV